MFKFIAVGYFIYAIGRATLYLKYSKKKVGFLESLQGVLLTKTLNLILILLVELSVIYIALKLYMSFS